METATDTLAAPPAAPEQTCGDVPVLVAGVAGGVGARTLTRLLAGHCPATTTDLARARQPLDVLVTSITAAAAAQLPEALAQLSTPPVLAVVHTVPGPVPPAARARIRAAQAHVRRTVSVPYVPAWTGLETPPGEVVPRRVGRARTQLVAAVDIAPHEGN